MQVFIDNKESEFVQNPQILLAQFLDLVQDLELTPRELYIIHYECLPKEANGQTAIAEIETLNIYTGTEKELLKENLNSLLEYIDQMGVFLAEKMGSQKSLDEQELFQYQEGISWLSSALESLSHYFPDLKQFHQNILQLNSVDPNKAEHLETIMNSLAALRDVTSTHFQKIYFSDLSQEQKDQMIVEFKENQEQLFEIFENIAAEISAGNENQAIVQLYQTVEYINTYLRVLPDSPKNQELTKELTTLLEKIVEALDAQDSVLAADFIDYDLSDFIKALLAD